MPRLTRAQLRAQEAEKASENIHQDADVVASSPNEDYDSFSTELSARRVLQDVSSNKASGLGHTQIQQSTPGKDFKAAENVNSPASIKASSTPRVLEKTPPRTTHTPGLENQSTGADLAEKTTEKQDILIKPSHEDQSVSQVNDHNSQTPEHAQILSNPSATAPSSAAQTPKFDPGLHSAGSSVTQSMQSKREDSFVRSIKSRTPAIMIRPQEPPCSMTKDASGGIIDNSPLAHAGRIEDSVAAIDELEEAIEQVSQELPAAMAADATSPLKAKSPGVMSQPATPLQMPSGSQSADHVSHPQTGSNDLPANLPGSKHDALPELLPSVAAKTIRQSIAPTATGSAVVTTKRKNSTKLSTSRAPFVPSKSTKPPTKSTFQLPGDIISAKMKAQREERLKQQETEAEAARKRTGFKARPVPQAVTSGRGGPGSSMTPRENAASRARMSLVAARKDNDGDGGVPVRKHTRHTSLNPGRASIAGSRQSVLPSSRATSGLSVQKKRTSAPPSTTLAGPASVAKAGARQPSVLANKQEPSSAATANTSAIRSQVKTQPSQTAKNRGSSGVSQLRNPSAGQPMTKAAVPRSSSISTSSQSRKTTVTAGPTTTTKTATTNTAVGGAEVTTKGKAAFDRPRLASEELARQKREKEEAARRARAEAAERGRLASREWAEKQAAKNRRKKDMSSTAAVAIKPVGRAELQAEADSSAENGRNEKVVSEGVNEG